jgi:RND family efflux transporter MFP subunit
LKTGRAVTRSMISLASTIPSRLMRPLVSALLLVSLGTLVSGCGKKSDVNAAGGAPPAATVQVQIAQNQRIPETTEYLSVLKSRHSSAINPQVEGQITQIFVRSGDRVKAGDPLLQIDPSKQEAALSSEEAAQAAQAANVQLADVSFERTKKLYEAGVVSKQEFDSAKSYYDAAVAQLKSLQDQVRQQKVQLQYYRVSAPTDGIVGDIPVRVGDRVTVSTLLTTVDEPGALEAYIYVPVDRSRQLKLGLPVHLLDANGQAITDTHITFVSPQVDTGTQTILAKAAVPNPQNKLRIAQQVRAQVTWGVHDGPVIPVLAVSRINGQFFAFVVVKESKGPTARQRILKLGDTIGNEYVVLDGIQAGDHIIVSGTQFLQDGAAVKEQIVSAATPNGVEAGAAAGAQ